MPAAAAAAAAAGKAGAVGGGAAASLSAAVDAESTPAAVSGDSPKRRTPSIAITTVNGVVMR